MDTVIVEIAAIVFAVLWSLRKARISPSVYLPMLRHGSAITSSTVM